MKMKKYQIVAEIGSAIHLPESEDYQLKLSIGEKEFIARKVIQGQSNGYKNFCRWSFLINETFESNHQGVFSFPHMFLYLMEGGNPIAYWKDSITNYENPNPKFKWVKLIADKAIKTIENYECGFLSFKLYLRDLEKFNNQELDIKQPNLGWTRKEKRQTVRIMRAHIYQGRNLPGMDDTGASDPYVEVYTPS